MSRHVPDERLEVIHAQFSGAIRKTPGAWVYAQADSYAGDGYTPIVEGHDLICLLDELRRRRQLAGRMGAYQLGKTTKILIAMGVGDVVDMEPITQGALTNARNRARRHLGIPDAVWRSQTLQNGLVRVTRMPDGSPVYDKRTNPAVVQMADMRKGQTTTLTTLRGKIYTVLKVKARRLMDDAAADWRCENLANGNVRCTRVR